ncbi:MAG: PaaI family thioesterase [Sphingomonadaceae bacterium]
MPEEGAAAHYRALERLYDSAPINRLFPSRLRVTGAGEAEIGFEVTGDVFHGAAAAHGSAYFKLLDDAAFFACNSLVTDHFLLTTAFNLIFTRPLREGAVTAHGRWVSGRRRVLIGEARLVDGEGEEAARGTGTFMRSRIALSGLAGYRGR